MILGHNFLKRFKLPDYLYWIVFNMLCVAIGNQKVFHW